MDMEKGSCLGLFTKDGGFRWHSQKRTSLKINPSNFYVQHRDLKRVESQRQEQVGK